MSLCERQNAFLSSWSNHHGPQIELKHLELLKPAGQVRSKTRFTVQHLQQPLRLQTHRLCEGVACWIQDYPSSFYTSTKCFLCLIHTVCVKLLVFVSQPSSSSRWGGAGFSHHCAAADVTLQTESLILGEGFTWSRLLSQPQARLTQWEPLSLSAAVGFNSFLFLFQKVETSRHQSIYFI